jgi:hypothetical protein
LGRELMQFVMQIPLPPDPLLERHRASICVDDGDWDGLQRHLSRTPIEADEPIAAVEALAKLGTTHSREIVHRVSAQDG